MLAPLTVVWGLGSACGRNDHVGRPCELGADAIGGASGQIVTISSGAVECPSGLCLGPIDNAQGTGARCTAHCESDDDCENNATGPKNDPSDKRCEGGFACLWPTTVGPYHCRGFVSAATCRRAGNSEAGRVPVSDEATLDSYGHVGNMAPPFGLWLLRRFSRERPSVIPQDAAKESP